MPVTVVKVGHVRVVVDQSDVSVRMGVRLPWGFWTVVLVPVMLVMHVRVVVLHLFVRVQMSVAFPDKQEDTDAHGHCG